MKDIIECVDILIIIGTAAPQFELMSMEMKHLRLSQLPFMFQYYLSTL